MYLEGAEQQGAFLRKQSQRKAQRAFLDCLGAVKLHQPLTPYRIVIAYHG